MKFAVTILRIPNHMHSHAFDDVAASVEWGIRALGYDVAPSREHCHDVPDDTRCVIFGAHLWREAVHGPFPKNAIVYNLEQTSVEWVRFQMKAVNMPTTVMIWDYSLQNLPYWKTCGVQDVQFVPVGYAPTLTNIERIPEGDRDIDVLFYGWMNPRRLQVCRALEDLGLNVVTTDKAYGYDRASMLRRARVVLNMHYYIDPSHFEIVRCSYAWANRIAVVSEESPDIELWQRACMITVPYENLAKTCEGLVKLPGVREEQEELAFHEFRKRDVRKGLEQALLRLVK